MNDSSFDDLIVAAIDGIKSVQGMSDEERKIFLRDNGPIPPNLSLGCARRMWTTQEGLRAIYEFGDKWRAQSQDRKRRLSLQRTRKFAEEVFGDALASGLWVDGNGFGNAREDLMHRFDTRLAAIAHDVIHSFPCHIFTDTSVGVFDVGPVRFWPRLEWLDQVECRAGKKMECAGYVRATWKNGDEPPTGQTTAELDARSLIRGVGACPWVATVTVQGNDIGRSEERARTAEGLAITALGLPMHHYLALKLRGPGDELRATEIIAVTQVADQDIGIGLRIDLSHLPGSPNFAKNFISDTVTYRNAVGKAIEAIRQNCAEGGVTPFFGSEKRAAIQSNSWRWRVTE